MLNRNWIIIALLLAMLIAAASAQTGLVRRTDEQFRMVREAILDRSASGDIHIVEIDAKSIVVLDSWPWKRRVHAQIVEKLSAAGAETIAFDVDFSSSSNAYDDKRFADALRRYNGTVILPTFVQRASANDDRLIESLPIESLRSKAFLASVNVQPDRDGALRSFEYGSITDGVVRPSMAAMLASVSGDIGRTFRIDTSINPDSIPRHSVIDLLNGKLEPGRLAGKSVVVGATAIELGDRYAMPRHGIQPGVVIQTLAAETLLDGHDYPAISPWIAVALALGFAFWTLRQADWRSSATVSLVGAGTLISLPFIVEHQKYATIDVAAGLYLVIANLIVSLTALTVARFNQLRLIDGETGLPNELAMARDIATGRARHAVVMHIANFNDAVAMLESDGRQLLLKNIAERMRLGTGDATIFRHGNSKLAFLSPVEDAVDLTELVDGLKTLVGSKIAICGHDVMVNLHFGIASVAEHNPTNAINNANLAAYQAENSGLCWAIFTSAVSDRNEFVQHILAGLDGAVERNEVFLVYQPKWSITQNRVVGVEALVRWNHALLGPMSPAEFIPILEQHRQMARLTLHIAEQCGIVARRWHAANRNASIALNISAPLLTDPQFTELLKTKLRKMGAARTLITFEITESAAVRTDTEIIESLQSLRRMGIKISIDDYGTGQSTLSYLQKFPADEIKIDQSFVHNLTSNRSDQILVRSTIELGHELGLSVIAEGVEDGETMSLLESYRCDMVQGWHIGRPMSVSEVERMIDLGCGAAPVTINSAAA